jgi:hypothetical protein
LHNEHRRWLTTISRVSALSLRFCTIKRHALSTARRWIDSSTSCEFVLRTSYFPLRSRADSLAARSTNKWYKQFCGRTLCTRPRCYSIGPLITVDKSLRLPCKTFAYQTFAIEPWRCSPEIDPSHGFGPAVELINPFRVSLKKPCAGSRFGQSFENVRNEFIRRTANKIAVLARFVYI